MLPLKAIPILKNCPIIISKIYVLINLKDHLVRTSCAQIFNLHYK